jgi:hypothetical protein
MDRRDRIAGIATKVVFRFIAAGQQEETIFDAAFSVLRKKAREYKDSLEQSARDSLQGNLIKDLTGRGYDVVSVEISLGKYRGSRFVTSAKVTVRMKDAKATKSLEKELQRYHTRYNLKSFEDGVAVYNIR